MPKVMCDFTACKYNAGLKNDDVCPAECLHEGEIVLSTVVDDDQEETLECKQFEWGEEA